MATFDPFDIRTLQVAAAGDPAVQNALSRFLTGFGVPADTIAGLFGEGHDAVRRMQATEADKRCFM